MHVVNARPGQEGPDRSRRRDEARRKQGQANTIEGIEGEMVVVCERETVDSNEDELEDGGDIGTGALKRWRWCLRADDGAGREAQRGLTTAVVRAEKKSNS